MRSRLVMILLSIVIVGVLVAAVQVSFAAAQAHAHKLAKGDVGQVSFSQEVSSLHARYGDILTYTLILTNTGAISPVNVLITDTLASTLAYMPASLWTSTGDAQYSAGVITWTDTLTPGATAAIHFQTRVAGANTTIINQPVIDEGNSTVYDGPLVSTAVAPVQAFLPLVANQYCGPAFDEFSNPASGWPVGDTTYWSYSYLNGEYRFYAKAPAYGVVTRGEVGSPVVEVDARQVSTVNGSYGIAYFIYPDWNNFEIFEIRPATQEYGAWSYAGGTWYGAWLGTSSAIHPGQGTNHLKIVDIGPTPGATNTYDFYVNGTWLFRSAWGFGDPNPLSTLRLGLTATADAVGFDVRFDNYKFVPAGCTSTPQSKQQLNRSPSNFFEMPPSPALIQSAWPMGLTDVRSPLNNFRR